MNLKTINWSLDPKVRSVKDEGLLDLIKYLIKNHDRERAMNLLFYSRPFMYNNRRTAFCVMEMRKGKRLCDIKKEFKNWLELLGDL